jgi:hypothetical protein
MTGGSVAAGFRGTWVPAAAACTSPLKLVIEANVVTFVNGAQHAEYHQLEQCFTCMGRDVDKVTLLSTDAMGDLVTGGDIPGVSRSQSRAIGGQEQHRFPGLRRTMKHACGATPPHDPGVQATASSGRFRCW